eukprot:GHVP01004932.1.p1 GENE.GHVP01004932.1~~GHVP01004932.1.p1  ORF type:complete len:266 (-),score=43.33 GHVP01004932.1:490-1203(-)
MDQHASILCDLAGNSKVFEYKDKRCKLYDAPLVCDGLWEVRSFNKKDNVKFHQEYLYKSGVFICKYQDITFIFISSCELYVYVTKDPLFEKYMCAVQGKESYKTECEEPDEHTAVLWNSKLLSKYWLPVQNAGKEIVNYLKRDPVFLAICKKATGENDYEFVYKNTMPFKVPYERGLLYDEKNILQRYCGKEEIFKKRIRILRHSNDTSFFFHYQSLGFEVEIEDENIAKITIHLPF